MNQGWFRIVIVLGLMLSGCGQSRETALDDDLDFSDADGTKKLADATGEPVRRAAALPQERFELKVKVGDRFPLVKVVEQRVMQGANSTNVSASSQLELRMAITVEDIQGPKKRFRVGYDRIKFKQTIGDQKVEYDSEQLRPNIPPEAYAYAGLVRNGFSFWLGAENELLEMIGFDDFLKRCLKDIPPEQQQAAFVKVASLRNEDGIANFIDHSMGLLPSQRQPDGSMVPMEVGSRWEIKPRRIEGPIPMTVSTNCLLQELTDREAVINVVGSISPAMASYDLTGVKAELKGGNCRGTCSVDRQTGIPTRTRVEQYLEMVVQMADGTQIPQRKQVVTTVQAFPDQGLLSMGPLNSSGLQPVQHEQTGNSRDRVKHALHEEKPSGWGR